MKSMKIVFASVLFVALAAMATAFTPASKKFTSANYKWNASTAFVIGTTSSSQLDQTSNFASGTAINNGTAKFSYISVSFTGTAPTEQQVLDQLQAEYDLDVTNGGLIQDHETWIVNINGVDVTFEAFLKA